MAFSCSKKHREEQRRLAEKASDMDFERLMQGNADAEIYDSEADDEAERLEIAIEWEKH